jgi:Ti-type conjugative transfer relaxase TraA
MAIYHFSAQVISRSAGRSAVAAASYRAAEKMHDERIGETFDFTRKGGVEYTELITPDNAPAWASNREELWNRVEAAEKRKDSQLAREVQLALPNELSPEAQVELVREFAREQFVSKGMVADIAIHRDNPENQHAHIMLTTRRIGPDGFGEKERDWNDRGLLIQWREEWARSANLALAREGVDIRIDHRSLAEQAIDLEPTRKLGVSPKTISDDGRDLIAERWAEQVAIMHRNGEAIRERPEIALDAITYQHATFTRVDVGRWLNTRTADAEQFQACLARVMNAPNLVVIGQDRQGRERFTTQEILAIEKGTIAAVREMESRSGNHQVEPRFIERAEASRALSSEQRAALRHVTDRGDIAVVEGYAGTGKSYMLGAAREAWEAAGYRVKGAALAGKAAEGLEAGAGIQSRSLHSWEYAWREGRDQLTAKDVLVIDEAGMVGSRQMHRVLEQARAAGAKVVLVGDTEQLQAIEAGAPMRAVAQEVGQLTLSEIRRQRDDWQREATQQLATGRTSEAFEAYEQRGHVHEHGTKAEAMEAMVQAWDGQRRARPEQTQILLAFRREDVRQLNERCRGLRRDAGELGPDVAVETVRGVRQFAEGDRVCFLRNDRELGVKNGTLGTIEQVSASSMRVRLDGGDRRVTVDLEQYNYLDHGYAATVHKSQGVTVDRAQALAGDLYDRHVTYVAMSRHREQVDLHWSREEIGDRGQLLVALGRERKKELANDYAREVSDERAVGSRGSDQRGHPGAHRQPGVGPGRDIAGARAADERAGEGLRGTGERAGEAGRAAAAPLDQGRGGRGAAESKSEPEPGHAGAAAGREREGDYPDRQGAERAGGQEARVDQAHEAGSDVDRSAGGRASGRLALGAGVAEGDRARAGEGGRPGEVVERSEGAEQHRAGGDGEVRPREPAREGSAGEAAERGAEARRAGASEEAREAPRKVTLAEALKDRLLAAELKRRFAQERAKGPSELERYVAELKQRSQEQAQKQEHTQERAGEKDREQEQQKPAKKPEQAQDKGRQRERERDDDRER